MEMKEKTFLLCKEFTWKKKLRLKWKHGKEIEETTNMIVRSAGREENEMKLKVFLFLLKCETFDGNQAHLT